MLSIELTPVDFSGDVIQGTVASVGVAASNRSPDAVTVPIELVDETPSGTTYRRVLANAPQRIGANDTLAGTYDVIPWGALTEPGCHNLRVELEHEGRVVRSETLAIEVEVARYTDGDLHLMRMPGGVAAFTLGRHQRGVLVRSETPSLWTVGPTPHQLQLPANARDPQLLRGVAMLGISWDVAWLEDDALVVGSLLPSIAAERISLGGRPLSVVASQQSIDQGASIIVLVENADGLALTAVALAPHSAPAPRSAIAWTYRLDVAAIGEVVAVAATLDSDRSGGVAIVGRTDTGLLLGFGALRADRAPERLRVHALPGAAALADAPPAVSLVSGATVGALVERNGVSQRVVWSVDHDQLSWLEGGPSIPIAARVFLRPSASGDAAPTEIGVVAMGPAREVELIHAQGRHELGTWREGEPLRATAEGPTIHLLRLDPAQGPTITTVPW